MSPRARTQDLPGRLKAVMDFIVAYKIANAGCSPTWAEIGKAVIGTPATSLVSFYLDKLVASGKIVILGRSNILIPGSTWTPPE